MDVGANVGQFTLVAARRVGPSGRVHAYEPTPELAAHILRNLELNGLENVAVNAVAVSDVAGRASLHFVELDDPGENSIVNPSPGTRTLEVPTVTLDGYLAEHAVGTVSVIKMDIEGAEMPALLGARNLLSGDDSPVLVLGAQSQNACLQRPWARRLPRVTRVVRVRLLPDRLLQPPQPRPLHERYRREAGAQRSFPGPAAVAAAAVIELGPFRPENLSIFPSRVNRKEPHGGLHHAGTLGQRDHPNVQPRLLRRQGDRQRPGPDTPEHRDPGPRRRLDRRHAQPDRAVLRRRRAGALLLP